jgi:glycine/D-amino acid oxidase-like deaminating enzyme
MSDTCRIAIVGGSIAGCAAAVELSRAGHKVKVFERSATQLVSQGAGIIAPAEVFRGMVARNLLPEDHPRCSVTVARYVRRDGDRAEGRWLGDVDFNLTTVSWADLSQGHRQCHIAARQPRRRHHDRPGTIRLEQTAAGNDRGPPASCRANREEPHFRDPGPHLAKRRRQLFLALRHPPGRAHHLAKEMIP